MSDSITITTISAIDDASRRSAAVVIPASKHLSLRELIIGEDSARDLVAKLTAWLDAPRLAARETPTVVVHDAVDDEIVMLLRTTVGEWCVRCVDSGTGHADEDWFATERDGRGHFADLRGKALCICGAECAEDEIDRSGDEPQCPKCVAEAERHEPPIAAPRPQCPTHGDTVNCYCTTGALHCHDCGHTPPFCTACDGYHDAGPCPLPKGG